MFHVFGWGVDEPIFAPDALKNIGNVRPIPVKKILPANNRLRGLVSKVIDKIARIAARTSFKA
jgi:hypothetical protein